MSSFYSKIKNFISGIKLNEYSKTSLEHNYTNFEHSKVILPADLLSQVEELLETNFISKRPELGYESNPELISKSLRNGANLKGYSSNPETSKERRESTRKSVVPLVSKSRYSSHSRLDTDKIATPMPETPAFMPDLSISITDYPNIAKLGQFSFRCSETEKAPVSPDKFKPNFGCHTAKILAESSKLLTNLTSR